MSIEQTDQRLFKGTTAEILAFTPPSFDGWTYAESTDDNTGFRWNSTRLVWETLTSQPFSRALYVDGGTTTPPAFANGSIGAPFKTIMAAVAVMTDDMAIMLMPGTYPESVTWPDFDRTALIGTDRAGCIIAPPAGDALRWVPGAGFVCETFCFQNLTLIADGFASLRIDASATPDFATKLGQLINLDCVQTAAPNIAVRLTRTGVIDVQSCRATNQVVVSNPSRLTVDANSVFETLFQYEYTPLSPTPAGGRGPVTMHGRVVGQANLQGAPLFILAADGVLVGTSGTALYGAPLVYFGDFSAPQIFVAGSIGTPLSGGGIALDLPAIIGPTANQIVDLTGARIFSGGLFTVVGPVRQFVNARDVLWEQPNPGGVFVGDFIDMDTRGATFVLSDAIFATPPPNADIATIDRDLHAYYGVALPAALSFPIDPNLPPGALYTVNVDPKNPVIVTVSAKTGAGFTLTPTADAGTVDVTLVRAN